MSDRSKSKRDSWVLNLICGKSIRRRQQIRAAVLTVQLSITWTLSYLIYMCVHIVGVCVPTLEISHCTHTHLLCWKSMQSGDQWSHLISLSPSTILHNLINLKSMVVSHTTHTHTERQRATNFGKQNAFYGFMEIPLVRAKNSQSNS